MTNGMKTKDIYELMEKMRSEILGEVKSLRQDFLEMEKGRLTRLESQFAEFKGENRVRITTTAGIVSAIMTLAVVLINKFL